MKLNIKNVAYALTFLLVIIFINFLLDGRDIFVFILSFSLFLIFVNSFSHINIKKQCIELKKENFINSQVKLFYSVIVLILLINLVYIGIIYIITLFFNNSYFMYRYNYVFLFMGTTIFIIPVINVLCQYLLINNHKKISVILKKLYYFILGILILVLIIFNYKLNITNYKFAILMYLVQWISFIITILCFLIFNNDKNIFKINHYKKRNENKICLKKQLKLIFLNNVNLSMKKIILCCYYYTSIIIVFYVLLYRFNYDYNMVIKVMTDTYLYETCVIFGLVICFLVSSNDNLSLIINTMKNNDYSKCDIHLLFINIIKKIIPITILLCVLSGPVMNLLFNINMSVVFIALIWVLPFIVLYVVGINLLEMINNKKILYIVLFVGIFIKIILIIPLINSFYRMGYNLLYGDILSNMIGLFVSYIITIVYLNKKYNVNFSKSFEKVLNVIYENIILMLILIMFSIMIPLNVDTKIHSLIVIIIYIFIFVSYFYIKNIILRIKMFNKK